MNRTEKFLTSLITLSIIIILLVIAASVNNTIFSILLGH